MKFTVNKIAYAKKALIDNGPCVSWRNRNQKTDGDRILQIFSKKMENINPRRKKDRVCPNLSFPNKFFVEWFFLSCLFKKISSEKFFNFTRYGLTAAEFFPVSPSFFPKKSRNVLFPQNFSRMRSYFLRKFFFRRNFSFRARNESLRNGILLR